MWYMSLLLNKNITVNYCFCQKWHYKMSRHPCMEGHKCQNERTKYIINYLNKYVIN